MSEAKRIFWEQVCYTPEVATNWHWCAPLNAWLKPLPDTLWPWPAPRDAKTDPPQPSDCDADGRILICGSGGRWFTAPRAALGEFPSAVWLSLPAPPQADAEKAWEVYCAVHGTPVSGFSKDMFIRGFNAGKGSK